MFKIVITAATAGAALTLAACSEPAEDTAAEGVVATSETVVPGAETTSVNTGAVLDANTATAAQLATAEGVTPELAEAIVAGRPYASVVDLNATLGETVPQGAAGAVLQGVFVPVNLNTATQEEIELIPGMSSRMVGEFLEYRPYENMEEFNREIGKYVDEAEVARFRNYVFL